MGLIANAVRQGVIGEVHTIRVTNRDPKAPPIDFVKRSGGIFFDFLIHDFDSVRFLSGSEIVEVYAAGARPFERVGEWIDRIGWPKFFELIGQDFTKYHIDDFTHAGETYMRTAQLRH